MAEVSVAIADDNRQTLNLLGEILEKEDGIHVVGKADNGEDAYNMIVETNPDIVLMDVIMPRLDGISVMERVRNNSQMKGTPSFIMVTAASSQDVTEDAFRLGANYYIMKPFSRDVVLDVYFGTDYHSHLGTRRGGMAAWDPELGFQREIHNIENAPFRTKFEKDLSDFHGCSGIGCISDTDPQPLLVRSHLGLYAITTVGIINNAEELVEKNFASGGRQFMAMSSGKVNATELVAALINQKDDLISGIRHAQDEIDLSLIHISEPTRH